MAWMIYRTHQCVRDFEKESCIVSTSRTPHFDLENPPKSLNQNRKRNKRWLWLSNSSHTRSTLISTQGDNLFSCVMIRNSVGVLLTVTISGAWRFKILALLMSVGAFTDDYNFFFCPFSPEKEGLKTLAGWKWPNHKIPRFLKLWNVVISQLYNELLTVK